VTDEQTDGFSDGHTVPDNTHVSTASCG